jgi:hypothetical protein
LNIPDISFRKAALTIAKVIVPHSNKGIRKPHLTNVINVLEKSFSPFGKGSDIVGSDILEMKQLQVCLTGNGTHNGMN